MPAYAARTPSDFDQSPVRIVNHGARQNACTVTNSAVGFLQCHYVGVDLVQYREDTFGIAFAVKADALVNVVTGKCQTHVTTNAPAPSLVPGLKGIP